MRSTAPLIAALLSVAASGAAGVALAADDARPDAARLAGQRSFGFGPTVGVWSGIGAVAGGGGETLKAWLSGGYAPVLVFANARTPDKAIRFNAYSAYQLNGDIELVLARRPRLEIGALLGYKFNNVIGHGGGAGLDLRYDIGPKVALGIAAGLAVFPSAKHRLDTNYAYPTDRNPGVTPALQGGANFGLIFYP